jgi:hypothetical protein
MRNKPVKWLLLILPVLLLPLATYVAVEGQMKLSGIIIEVLFITLLECIAIFLYRCVQLHRGRQRKKG